MTTDWQDVSQRLRRLAEAPMPAEPVFAAGAHHFEMEPPLSAEDLASAESQFGVVLPTEYRQFLLTVGAGGAGPDYGLFPLRGDEDGWRWHGSEAYCTRLDDLDEPFPVDPQPSEEYQEILAAEPMDDDFEDEDDYEEAHDEWAQELDQARLWDPSRDCGAICVSTAGCGSRAWLVVSGPAAGQVWDDNRIDGHAMTPATDRDGNALTFATWYLQWLDKAEKIHLGT